MTNTILLIVNPVSGGKKSKKILPNIISDLESNNFKLEIIESEFRGHINKILQTFNIKDYYCCCIVGGDGSFHEAINGLMIRSDHYKIPLCLIPSGSGNSLARDIDILDYKKSIEKIVNGKPLYIDIAQIECKNQKIYSFNIAGWGMVASIGEKAEQFRWLGTSRYTILSLFEIIFKKTNQAQITFYDKNNIRHDLDDKFMFAMISNTVHTGKGMKIAPKAKLNDGLLDLVLIKDTSRFKLLNLMNKLFSGNHIHDSIVEYRYISKSY